MNKTIKSYSHKVVSSSIAALNITSENCLNSIAKIEYDKNIQQLLFDEIENTPSYADLKTEIRNIIDDNITLNMVFMGFCILNENLEILHQSTAMPIEPVILPSATEKIKESFTNFFNSNDPSYFYLSQKFFVTDQSNINPKEYVFYSVSILDKNAFFSGTVPSGTILDYKINVSFNGRNLWAGSSKTGDMFEAKNGFKVEIVSPKSNLLIAPSSTPISYVAIILIVGIITVGIGYLNNKSITKPIKELSDFCTKVPTQLDIVPIDKISGDELTEIGVKINEIISSLNKSKDELIFKEQSIFKMELEKQQLSLDMLYSQINSHFLYNTLSNIRGMALKDGNEEVADSLHLLVQYFRYCTNQKNTVSIKDELDALAVYLKIQTMRFGKENISYSITCPEDLKERNILRMLLQPLTENCFSHGFKEKTKDCKIDISIEKISENKIKITVSDNGNGCDKQIQNSINSNTLAPSQGTGRIGICNIRKRLKVYDPEYEFNFDTGLNGTQVSIILTI